MIALKPTKGHLLVAEPSIIGDVAFNRSVVLLADHSEAGSVGFILNKALDFTLKDLVPDLSSNFKIYNGGPVEQDNLYFIQKLISEKEIRFFLGYSGWDANQLDEELSSHAWIVTTNENPKDIIERPYHSFWKDKMMQLGGEYILWSNAPENPSYN